MTDTGSLRRNAIPRAIPPGHVDRRAPVGSTIGPIVKREVVDQGRAISALGVEQVETALGDGWIRVATLTGEGRRAAQRISRVSGLHEGEAESIALAHAMRDLLIVDDSEAGAVADAMHLEYLGTAAVILKGFLEGHFGMSELEEAVEELARTVWLSPAVVTEILRRARSHRHEERADGRHPVARGPRARSEND